MADLLVRLYDLPAFDDRALATAGITLRRPLAPEMRAVLDWIGPRFATGWVSEASVALHQTPPTIFIALRGGELLGFACYDATAKGFFGPTGVAEAARGQGVGSSLLFATLRAMREAGYGYAVIGGVGPVEFYRRHLDIMEIPGSTPGLYAGMLAS
jgi:GNAT superfamily N-acetyltransferase